MNKIIKKKYIAILTVLMLIFSLTGCNNTSKDTTSISETTKDAIENLYSIQENFSNGVNPLMEIPVAWTQEVYDNADDILNQNIDHAPIMLREYAAINTVYFDYDSDYSVVWDKNNNSVHIEATDTAERDEFSQKQHK